MHVDYGISFISLKNIFPPSAMCHQALKLPLDHVDSPCAMLAVFGGSEPQPAAMNFHEKLLRRSHGSHG